MLRAQMVPKCLLSPPRSWRRTRAFGLAGIAFLVLTAACDDPVGPTTEILDQILFVSDRAGAGDIYRMNVDGTGVENLTIQPAEYLNLGLSPDGSRIVFESDLAGCYDIFVMNLDATVATQLTGVEAYERCNEQPHWSPDGSKIAFFSSRDVLLGTGWDAYVMNADGSGVVNVGNNPSSDPGTFDDKTHGWSPDGKVVLHSTRDGMKRTFLVNPDGTGLQRLLDLEGYAYPYWSPDGGRIAFSGEQDGDWELFVMNADGTGVVNVTDHPAWDGFAGTMASPWSPDGSRIAFTSRRTGNAELYVVNADGTGLVNLSDDEAEDDFLQWSPDGSQILFTSERTGDMDIYIMDADGTGIVNLTKYPGAEDSRAIWVPRH